MFTHTPAIKTFFFPILVSISTHMYMRRFSEGGSVCPLNEKSVLAYLLTALTSTTRVGFKNLWTATFPHLDILALEGEMNGAASTTSQ